MKRLAGLLCLVAGGAFAQISDHVQFGDAGSEQAHRVVVSGAVTTATMRTQVGLLRHEHQTRAFAGRGATLSFEMKVPVAAAAARVLLDFQEVHDRRPDVFGYTVLVGDREVYFRNYEEISGGPNHYFIEIDRALVGKDGTLPVRVRSESAAPFNLSQVWVYPNFTRLAEQENVFRKLGFVLGAAPALAGLPEGADRLAVAQKLKELYGGSRSFEFGLFTSIPYARFTQQDTTKRIQDALEVSAMTGLPYGFMFSSWWGTAAVGPDGRGGYFSDLLYESVSYDPQARAYRPSFPNQWGNTLWPTKSNEHLNRFNNYRLEMYARTLSDQQARFTAAGTNLPVSVIYAEMGPNYGPDFNPAAIEAARRDGIPLNPEDGLSREEGRWIHHSYARYFGQQVPAYRAGLGRGDIVVDRGRVTLPSDPLYDNIFTHGFWAPGAPLHDPKQAYWQANLNDGMWCSGELYEYYPQAYYDYITAISRVTCVNLERALISDLRFMKTAYGAGLEFVTLFNALPGDEKHLHAMDGLEDQPNPPASHDRRLLDAHFGRDQSLPINPAHLRSENLVITHDRLRPVQSGVPGRVLYRVRDPETAFAGGLRLEFQGACGAGTITFRAGPVAHELRDIRRFTAREMKGKGQTYRVDLGEVARGRDEVLVEVELAADGLVDQVELKTISALLPWPKRSGQADGAVPTLRTSRLRSLWLQQRARLDRVLKEYRERGGSAEVLARAEALRREGRYASAWRLLTGETARLLPARYTVRGHGQLAPYPIHIEAPDVVQVELITTNEFQINVEREQLVKVTFRGLSGTYRLEQNGNRYALRQATDGTAPSFELTVAPAPAKSEFPVEPVAAVPLPRQRKGKYEEERGMIQSFTPPSVTGQTCNGIVELQSGARYELCYTPWWTKCDMVGLTDLKSLGLDGITAAFRPGVPVRIEYEPLTYPGRLPRIHRVSQPVKTLLQEDYTKAGTDWASRALEVSGLKVAEYRGQKLYPTKNWQPGHVIYRVTNDRPLGQTALAFTGRLILHPANRITFFVRVDGGEWTRCGEFVTASPGANNTRANKFVDVTDAVAGKTAFDLKIEMLTTDTTWCSITSLQVRTLDSPEAQQ